MDEVLLLIGEISFLTLREKIFLAKNIIDVNQFAKMELKDLEKIIGRKIKSKNWDSEKRIKRAILCSSILKKLKIGMIKYEDDLYPSLLKEIFDPPFMLFYRGNAEILNNSCISIAGSRDICRDSAVAAFNFSKDAATDDKIIVSGLSDGIDSFAQKGVLSVENGKSIVVLPCGIDSIIPSSNKILASKILKNGCIISEYAPGYPCSKHTFVQRNRIVAGLSFSTVIMQAPPESGALITADFAKDFNRDLYFHEAGFCADAKKISEKKLKKLACDKKYENKKLYTSENYVEDGAFIIKNYADFMLNC